MNKPVLKKNLYSRLTDLTKFGAKSLVVLIDPDKFRIEETRSFLKSLPREVPFLLLGGSTDEHMRTEAVVKAIKAETDLPLILFPGDYSQVTAAADAILFLSLLSGRNPEYLIEQQVRSIGKLRGTSLEIIPTGYILIDGGKECAVQKVSGTLPISQDDVELIIDTALAGQYSGKKLIYLEAGSGALFPVSEEIIAGVRAAIDIPLIVGGGVKDQDQLQKAYTAGADIVVVGTAFEKTEFSGQAGSSGFFNK